MNIYELYFENEVFRGIVDNFVIKHRTTYVNAFKCMEIKNAYKAHLDDLGAKANISTL